MDWVVEPHRVLHAVIRPDAPFLRRLTWDAHPYPQYAYGLYKAAVEAQRLEIPAIAAVEFGVAGGRGLVALEQHARDIEAVTGTRIAVYGLDAGDGLPAAATNRDLPYVWRRGQFTMDRRALEARLQRAELILGDVADTVEDLKRRVAVTPVGFVAFDLDYYTSTVAALRLFDAPDESLLPRVFCFFDDIIGGDDELHSRFAGELLAIDEFNAEHDQRKLGLIYGLRHKRRIQAFWNESTYVLHCFDHPLYTRYVGPDDWQIPLES
jgi:hypothetical protein